MTHESREHPSDAALAGWVDERTGDDRVAPHLAHCAACRDRVAELERVVAALGAEPAPPVADALAANRTRILAAIGAPGVASLPVPVRRLRRRALWWLPTAAAAALAVLVLLRGGEPRQPATADDTVALPVIAAAQRAADETAAVLAAAPAETVESSEGAAEPDAGLADIELAVLDPGADAIPGAMLADFDLVDDFSSLAAEDQKAVLEDLRASEFEL